MALARSKNRAAVDGAALPGLDPPARLLGLEGIRGLTALYVVVHHCWLLAFPGFPANTGPGWTEWLLYGHFGVVVFIVLSGFSLAIRPARTGWQIGDIREFFRRRAWRILPPYWAALVISLIIAWTVMPQPGLGTPTGKSVLVFGLLAQDIVGAPSPNGAFWSIAVEAQLYLVFPLLLILMRRVWPTLILGLVTVVTIGITLLSDKVSFVELLLRFTPQFAVLFTVGIVAAKVVSSRQVKRVPWPLLALLAAAPVIILIKLQGSIWTASHFFWVDMALGPAVGLMLIGVAIGQPKIAVWVLETAPMRHIGSFSYSLYLTHAPIVAIVYTFVVSPRIGPGVSTFALTVAISVPVALIFGRLFASIFELPFVKYRSFRSLTSAVRSAVGNRSSREHPQQHEQSPQYAATALSFDLARPAPDCVDPGR